MGITYVLSDNYIDKFQFDGPSVTACWIRTRLNLELQHSSFVAGLCAEMDLQQ
jgi:hypothetical protein